MEELPDMARPVTQPRTRTGQEENAIYSEGDAEAESEIENSSTVESHPLLAVDSKRSSPASTVGYLMSDCETYLYFIFAHILPLIH